MLGRDAAPAGVMPHTSSPRAALGSTSPGALRLRARPTAVGGESRMSRGGAPNGETHPVTCVGPVGHGSSPKETFGLICEQSRSRVISARHTPRTQTSLRSLRKLDCGGKEKETGHPQPEEERGPAKHCLLLLSPPPPFRCLTI